MKPKLSVRLQKDIRRTGKKYGKIGKPLLNMPLISRTLLHGLPIKQLIKTNYPEYMAAVLSNNMSIKVSFFMENVSEWDSIRTRCK
jgi:hypothetical protein